MAKTGSFIEKTGRRFVKIDENYWGLKKMKRKVILYRDEDGYIIAEVPSLQDETEMAEIAI